MRFFKIECGACSYEGFEVAIGERAVHFCPSCGSGEIPHITMISEISSSADHPLYDLLCRLPAV